MSPAWKLEAAYFILFLAGISWNILKQHGFKWLFFVFFYIYIRVGFAFSTSTFFFEGYNEPEAHKSEKIIHQLVMETTSIGNKHWSQIPEGHAAVAARHRGGNHS